MHNLLKGQEAEYYIYHQTKKICCLMIGIARIPGLNNVHTNENDFTHMYIEAHA